jgi:hypothetical protein
VLAADQLVGQVRHGRLLWVAVVSRSAVPSWAPARRRCVDGAVPVRPQGRTGRRGAVAGCGWSPRRFSTPAEVADLVLLLASDRTANVTGAGFTIDGGLVRTLRPTRPGRPIRMLIAGGMQSRGGLGPVGPAAH